MPTGGAAGGQPRTATRSYELRMRGSYGYSAGSMPTSFRPGETLVGTAAEEKRTILVENVPPGYLRISSGLGEAPPAHVIVLPVLFEGKVLGVIELASFQPFTHIQKDFLNQIAEMIAITRQHHLASTPRPRCCSSSRRSSPSNCASGRPSWRTGRASCRPPTPSWRRRPSCWPSRTATSR